MSALRISSFKHHKDPQVAEVADLEWADLEKYLRERTADGAVDKAALAMWSAATFANAHRKRENVEAVYALTFDVDEDPIPSDDDLWNALEDWAALVHSSSSATRAAPRWRAVICLSRPVNADEYDRLWLSVSSALTFRVGQSSKDPSRAWYVPRPGSDGFFDLFVTSGEPLDVDEWLAKGPPKVEHPALAKTSGVSDERQRDLDAAAAALGAAWPEQNRHWAQLALAGALYSSKWSREAALEFLCAVCAFAGNEERSKREQTIEHTWSRGDAGEPLTGWSTLASYVGQRAVVAARSLIEPKTPAEVREELRAKSGAANDTTPVFGESRPRFEVVSASSLATPIPPVDYIWKHFGITRGRPSLLAGYGGSGKTIIVQTLALHMAAGIATIWGLPLASGSVLHVDYEMTLDPIKRRYQRLATYHGIDLSTCALDVCSMPSIYLSDEEAEDELAKVCAGRTLCLIDNLAAATATAVEGENEKGMRKYLDLLTRVSARTACCFVVLVHERKTSSGEAGGIQRVRGASAITDAAGAVVSISAAEGDGVVTMTQTKASHRKPGEPIVLRIEDTDRSGNVVSGKDDVDAPGLRVVRVAERPVDERDRAQEQRVLDLLARGPLETKKEIERRLGGRKGLVGPAVDRLVVRREVVFLPGRGFALDCPKYREERILEAVNGTDAWRSPAQVAKAAHAETDDVVQLIHRGVLRPDSTGRLFQVAA